MPWSAPTNPIPGTVITAAQAITNWIDPIRWLRLMTGNADPPGSSYVVVSSSTSGTAWSKVPADALAAGVALSNLGYTPVNRAQDLALVEAHGWAASSYLNGTANILFLVSGQFIYMVDIANPGSPVGVFDVANDAMTWHGTAVFDGALSAASAAIPGHLAGGTVGLTGALSAASIAAATATLSGVCQASRFTSTVPPGTPPFTVASNTLVPNLRVANADAAINATNAANAVSSVTAATAANANLLEGSTKAEIIAAGGAAAGGVPSGLGAWVPTAAAIPATWTRYTELDGRVPVGAGTTFSVTYTENTAGGSSWSHQHTGPEHSHTTPAHAHSGADLTISGTTGSESASGASGGTGTNRADSPHTHGVGSLDVAGSTATDGGSTSGLSGTGATSLLAWVIPHRVVVWIRKT